MLQNFSRAVLFVALSLGVVCAQELPPADAFEEFEVATPSTLSNPDFLTQLRKNFSLTVAATGGSSDSLAREAWSVDLGVDTELRQGLKLVALARVNEFDTTLTQIIRDPNKDFPSYVYTQQGRRIPEGAPSVGAPELVTVCKDETLVYKAGQCDDVAEQEQVAFARYRAGDVLPAKRKTRINDEISGIYESYLQWDVSETVTLRAGRQRLLWGQFNLFSPATGALPFASSGTTIRSGKADLLYPQDVLSVSVFPRGNVELSLFQSLGMRFDPQQSRGDEEYDDAGSRFVLQDYGREGLQASTAREDTDDLDFQAARIMYYAPRFTLGATYVEGYDIDFATRDMRVSGDCAYEELGEGLRTAYDIALNKGEIDAAANHYCIAEDNGYFYENFYAWSVEFAYPLSGGWTAKAETMTYDFVDRLLLPEETQYAPLTRRYLAEIVSPARGADAGRLLRRRNILLYSVGADLSGDKWLASIQWLGFHFTEHDKLLSDLEREAVPPVEPTFRGIPLISAGRKLGPADEGFLGIGIGAYFQSIGFGFFGGWTFFESLEVGGFIGYANDASSDRVEDAFYETDNEGAVFLFGTNYRF